MEARPKILIIDDEEVVLDSCAMILRGGDQETVTASDGTRGLALVEELKPDLIFVDLKMPGISGFEVLDRIREVDPTLVTIVITGYATVDSAVDAMRRGAYDFLPKPFSPDEFRMIVRRGLEKRRLVLEAIALRQEKEMLRENFAAIVSHELKSPLGAVQQNLWALESELSTVLNESQMVRLKRMESSLDGLMKVVRGWLKVYSVDLDGLAATFQPVSLTELLSKAVQGVQSLATRKDVEVVTSAAEPLPSVIGDETTLTEALVNLLGNAIKYSQPGSQVKLEARVEGDDVLLAVIDQGVGISREDLPHIFEGFRVGKPGPEAERGSGLGLAITRRIVEVHHGSLSVESELGKGSKFTIRLPCQVNKANPAHLVAES
jgi:two-component system sensor histidine kinase/response regulator